MVATADKRRISLEVIQIASPCTADWAAMSGDERSRHCSQCDLNVYNLSEMSREEAEAFLTEREGRVCVRLYRRADGTVITRDCPVGLRAVRAKIVQLALATAGLLLAFTATALAALGKIPGGKIPGLGPFMYQSRVGQLQNQHTPFAMMMGDFCVPVTPPAPWTGPTPPPTPDPLTGEPMVTDPVQ